MGCVFGVVAQWVMRVSLSDWLALRARIRGSKDPRLLKDRHSDGAALQQNLCESCGHCVQVYGEHLERHVGESSKSTRWRGMHGCTFL